MNARRDEAAFTFLEILIVVTLMGVFMLAFLPQIGGAFGFRIRNASREVAGELAYTAQRAIATGRLHRWQVDLDEQTFRIEELDEIPPDAPQELPTHADLLDLAPPRSTAEFKPIESRAGEWRKLDSSDVLIDEVRRGDEQVQSGTTAVSFAPVGGADPAEIRLVDTNGLERRVRVLAFTGEVRVEEVPHE